jgi:prepilin-type processing-associated H-X9-DG protein
MPSRSRDLTAIEIAVTVTLVLLFARFMIPVFGAASAGHEVEACHSNLRDLGIASRMYAADHGNMLYRMWHYVPPGTPNSLCTDGRHRLIHLQVLRPWLPEGSSLTCPASVPVDCCHPLERSYHPQTWLWRDERGQVCEAHMDQLGPPEQTMLWGEGEEYLSIHPHQLDRYANHSVHGGGSNVCFVDGHVAWVSKDDLLHLHYGGTGNTSF